MQAMVHDRYGSPDLLRLRELATPAIGPGEVLIRARAASLHPGDLFAVLGSPFPVRLATGLRRPKHGVPGFDVAGTVEAVGSAVTDLRSGDEVFGVGIGTCAALVRAKADFVVARPASVGFEEAAAIPTSALAALHGLRDAGGLQPGQRLLVNGASGGVGSFAVQLGKILGAEVTGVCSTANVELVRSLGADRVVDYTREDFTTGADRYDLILDNIENRPLSAVRRALLRAARSYSTAGPAPRACGCSRAWSGRSSCPRSPATASAASSRTRSARTWSGWPSAPPRARCGPSSGRRTRWRRRPPRCA